MRVPRDKIIKQFEPDRNYTELGIKNIAGEKFWNRYEKLITENGEINDGFKKLKKYTGKLLQQLAESWNHKDHDIELHGKTYAGMVTVKTQDLLEYILQKCTTSKSKVMSFRYVELYSLLCGLSVDTRYISTDNNVIFYEEEEIK